MRVVGETEAFLGNAEQVAIETGVAVLVVNHGDRIITRRQMGPDDRSRTLAGGDRGRTGAEGFVFALRPSIRRLEDHGTDDSFGVPQSVDVDAQGAVLGVGALVSREWLWVSRDWSERKNQGGHKKESAYIHRR